MKLFQIEYLISTCKTGSISKAADELLVSRPAVSRALRELELEYGIELFSRTSSGIELTEAGQTFYDECVKIQNQINDLEIKMSAFKRNKTDGSRRTLNIGTSYTAGYSLIPLQLAFCKEYPDIDIIRTEIGSEESFIFLNNDSTDLNISICFDNPDSTIDYITVETIDFVFCCSKNHKFADRSTVTVEDIKDEPLVALVSLMQRNNRINSLFASKGLKPNIAYSTAQVSMMKHVIKEGLYSTIKPLPSVSDDPDLVTIPFDPPYRFPMRIQWRNDIKHSSAFFDFLNFAKKYFGLAD